MKKVLFALILLLPAACDSKKNAATTYAGALKEDVDKAHAAADKANAALAQENQRTQEAQEQTK